MRFTIGLKHLRQPTPIVATPGYVLTDAAATLTSLAGAIPIVDVTMGSDIYVGYYLRIQRNATGSSGYGSPTLDVSHILTAAEKANGAIPNANLTGDGYTNPSGAYWQRYRWEREDGAFGAWSEVSGTVTVTTTTLDPLNKQAGVALSNGNLTMTAANQGSPQGIRTTQQVAVGAKVYTEMLVSTLQSNLTPASLGVCTSAFTVSTLGSKPGIGNSEGGAVVNNARYPGASYSGHDQAQGDVMMLAVYRVDASNVKYWIGWNGSWKAAEDPVTNTGGISIAMTSCYGYFAVQRVDVCTANFGATAFTYTKPTGFTAWG